MIGVSLASRNWASGPTGYYWVGQPLVEPQSVWNLSPKRDCGSKWDKRPSLPGTLREYFNVFLCATSIARFKSIFMCGVVELGSRAFKVWAACVNGMGGYNRLTRALFAVFHNLPCFFNSTTANTNISCCSSSRMATTRHYQGYRGLGLASWIGPSQPQKLARSTIIPALHQ